MFGAPYIDRFARACLLSLGWPKNRAALSRFEVWDIWTTKEDAKAVKAKADTLGVPVETHLLNRGMVRQMLLDAMRGQMRMCHAEGSGFVWVSPDLICGDGSLSNILQLGEIPGFYISVPTLRVDETGFIEAMGPGPYTNAQLVTLAFKHLHPDFVEGEMTRKQTNAWRSGVVWRNLGDGMYAVSHLMPSPFLCQPTKRHMEYWESAGGMGEWDHHFPRLLVEDQCQRVVGSSDAAFFVELTPPNVGRPPVEDVVEGQPDRYRHDRENFRVNRNTVCIWRAG